MKKQDRIVTTIEGKKVLLRPVSHLLLSELESIVVKEFQAAGEPLDRPTYTVELAGGSTATYPHDENTLIYPIELALRDANGDEQRARDIARQKTAEARTVWLDYRDAHNRLAMAIRERQNVYILDEGVEADPTGECWDGTIPEDWLEKQRTWGFEVPTPPTEQRRYYLLRGILTTARDQVSVYERVLRLTVSGISNDQIDAALSFFRDTVEGEDAS